MSQVMTQPDETKDHFLTTDQLRQFERDGYLLVKGVLDPAESIDPLIAEYEGVLDRLARDLHGRGEIASTYGELNFSDRLVRIYQETGRDFASNFDCCLPSRGTTHDTPMWLGPAVFDILRHDRVLDLVESIIGPEITSNPVQHVRIKPPEHGLPEGADHVLVRATNWHQDNAAVDPVADDTDMLTVWISLSEATIENGVLARDSGESSGRFANPLLAPARRYPRRAPGNGSNNSGADTTRRRDSHDQVHLP